MSRPFSSAIAGDCSRSPDNQCHLDIDGETVSFTWGRLDALGSANFWIDQTKRHPGYSDKVSWEIETVNLRGQVVFCLLGGHGVTAEMAAATYAALTERVDLDEAPSPDDIESALLRPVLLNGRQVRYRFWRQRSKRIAEALRLLDEQSVPTEERELRDWLTLLPGVGMKTASWIVRNSTGSNKVAIVDIWLVRALTRAGVFRIEWQLPRDYRKFEAAFLGYADAGNVAAAELDWCIWELARVLLPTLPPVVQ